MNNITVCLCDFAKPFENAIIIFRSVIYGYERIKIMQELFSFTLMDVFQVIIGTVGLLFIVLGWIIPNKQNIKEQKRQRKFEEQLEIKRWRKAHVDDQIRLLYGPISQLLNEQSLISSFVSEQFGRRMIFCEGKDKLSDLDENEQKIWVHYVITYVLPYQQKILSILRNNQHLIDGDKWPDCYRDYMKYTLAWEYLQNQKDNEVPNFYQYKSIGNYPREFNYYISSTTSKLLDMQKQLEKIEIDD